jgi:amino acid adenylation domain-containing protein
MPLQIPQYNVSTEPGIGLEVDREYWRAKLCGMAPARLPLDFKLAEPAPACEMEVVPVDLPHHLADRVLRVCSENDTLMLAVLVTALKIVMRSYSWQDDVSVGTTIHETHREIALFNEVIVLRSTIESHATLRETTAAVQRTLGEAYAHQKCSFAELEQTIRSPLFYVAITLEPINDPRRLATATKDMHLAFSRNGCQIKGRFEFDRRLFRSATVRALIEAYFIALSAVLSSPDKKVQELSLVPDHQARSVLEQLNSDFSEYPSSTVIHLFRAQVASHAQAPALVTRQQTLTYDELNKASNQLAHHLRKSGVTAGSRVGILLNRSLEWVTAVLAVLKIGATYVPLDQSYPPSRLLEMIEESCLSLVIAKARPVDAIICGRVRLLYLNEEEKHIAAGETDDIQVEVPKDSLAYVMFTSGSTGRPKAIGVSHRAICRLVCGTDYIQISPSDRIAQCSNVSFDASTFEVWGALLNGACSILFPTDTTLSPERFSAEIIANKITILFLTTALFNTISAYAPNAFGPLQYLLFGGEAVDVQSVRRILAACRPRHLLHVYGPTENTTFSSWYEVNEVSEAAATIPIGRAIAKSQLYVLDSSFYPVPEGALGEIFVGGPGLAQGYISRPDLTAGSFLPNPFGAAGERLYRTGDRGRIVCGNLEFVGRVDDQLKIRGFRVEPGEIMCVLKSHASVRDSFAVARRDPTGAWNLFAYVLLEEGSSVTPGELREFVRQSVPDYMVPSAVLVMSSWPLNANGKIDRRALPEPGVNVQDADTSLAGPVSPTEQALIDLWTTLLGAKRVRVQDDFFELGGHSLLAAQFVSEVAQHFQVELPLQIVFEQPTIKVIAAVIDDLKKSGATVDRPSIKVTPRRPHDAG